jgi:hypothetical protein
MSKNIEVKIYKTVVLPLVFMDVKCGVEWSGFIWLRMSTSRGFLRMGSK